MSTRINLATNPSATTAITNWAAVAGTGGTAAAAYNAGTGYSGVGFARTTWTVATSALSGGCSYTQTGLSAAVQYAHQIWVRSSKTQSVALTAVYKTSASATVNTVVGATVALVANVWAQLTVVGTSGAAVDRVVLTAAAATGGANWAAAGTFDGDAVLIEATAAAGTYFDGASPSAAWNGTANASTSTLYIPVVTLTPFTDANPSPRALAVITDMAPAVQTINLQRTAEGRTMKVRAGVNLFAVGGATVMDFETPFGVPASYQAEQFDVTGTSLGFANAVVSTVNPAVPDTSYAWIHQPLSPTLAVLVSMRVDTAADVTRQSPGQIIFPEGATVGTRIGGQRQGITGMKLTIVCASGTDADEFLSMFGGYSTDFPAVLCIRSMPPVRLPRVFFASIAETHEVTDYTQAAPFITFEMTVDEVRPPSPGLVLPSLRMKDIDFPYATMNAQDAAYATNLAQDSDYSLAGVAGP